MNRYHEKGEQFSCLLQNNRITLSIILCNVSKWAVVWKREIVVLHTGKYKQKCSSVKPCLMFPVIVL